MKILFDIGHPGHVHLFKHMARLFQQAGIEVYFAAREKEFEIDLLKKEGFPFVSFGKHYKSLVGKIWGLAKFDFKMFLLGLRFKPDLFVSHGSIYAAHAAFLLRKKHLAIEDTGNMEQTRLHMPFTDVILTPDVYPHDLGSIQRRFGGYLEIAYLHPEFFEPDPKIYEWLGLAVGEKFAIVRFVGWNATHDVGQKGLSNEDKVRLVEKLSAEMKVYISSEAELPDALLPYRFPIPPDKFHHALYFADIVVSEGATVASEAGVLGTPAIYINSIPITYCQDQEKYGLVFNTSQSGKVFSVIDQVLQEERSVFRERSKKLLAEKVNVTRYVFDFIIDRYAKPSFSNRVSNPETTQEEVG